MSNGRNCSGTRILFALLVLTTLAVWGCAEKEAPEGPRPAPDFALASIDGNRVTLGDLKGKVVLLDFWATWCPPCRAAIPHLVDMQNKYRSEGFAVLGMNMDYDEDELVAFLGQQQLNYPVLRVDDDTRLAYGGVASIPQHFLVDKQGKIRKKYLGYDAKIAAEMEQLVQTLLTEPAQ